MRKVAVLTWLFMLLATIVAVFWQYEWIYSLPTPVPNNYQVVDRGTSINNKLLQNNATIIFDQFALKAYGCQLPKCAP